jgi:hypothetical protein
MVIAGGVCAVKGSPIGSRRGGRQQEKRAQPQPERGDRRRDRAILGPNHDLLLKQMAGTKLDGTAPLGPEDTGRDAPAAARPAGLRRPKVI